MQATLQRHRKNPICIFTGTDGEYDYFLSVTSPAPGEPQLIALIISARYAPD